MKLLSLVENAGVPEPWVEGEKIPWHEPGFSERMLREHLSQAHDAASRRSSTIDAHVAWIHAHLLGARSTRVPDLGCGPGLYTSRLAALGHSCTGVDFSPASIAHARRLAQRGGQRCEYVEGDLRTVELGRDYAFAMLIFGELNAFRAEDARAILERARAALVPGGRLLLETWLQAVDREAAASYLETDRDQNLALYRRAGFEVRAEIRVLGIDVWCMWRPPSPAASARKST